MISEDNTRVSFVIKKSKAEFLDVVAKALNCSKSFLINTLLDDFFVEVVKRSKVDMNKKEN